MYALVGLAKIGLPTLAGHDSKALTEGVVLQPGPSIVRCIERLILAGRKKMEGLDAIDHPLDNRNEIFFEVGTWYSYTGCRRDRGAERAADGDDEVCKEEWRCVYGGIHSYSCCGVGCGCWAWFGVGLIGIFQYVSF